MAGFFNSIYSHGFIRASVGIPSVDVANPRVNASNIISLADEADKLNSTITLFPELSISGYTAEDLFHQTALLDNCTAELHKIVHESLKWTTVVVLGVPLMFEGSLYNCAVILHRGRILGIVPKSYLPNYREFYEKRQFTSGLEVVFNNVSIFNQIVPFGNNLIFAATDIRHFKFHVEICEDLWVPIPPGTYAAMGGATVLLNMSASNITTGKPDYRRLLCASQSGRCVASYMYGGAGFGESTTDLAWDGHAMIYENAELIAESGRFSLSDQLITTDIDLDRLIQERIRLTSFTDAVQYNRERLNKLRYVTFTIGIPDKEIPLMRKINRFPYVPLSNRDRDDRCREVYNIQIQGLLKRLQSTEIKKVIIGISGGLDSTHALIVAAKTMDLMKLPRKNIIAITMPGYATGEKTLANARQLMNALKVTLREIDIRPSSTQMLHDIGHPYAKGSQVYDTTFENVQAGDRTSHLFRVANLEKGLVIGTSDLSELALGWTTYGVGDQMSHYNVNVSVPKTLIQYLIRWVADDNQFGKTVSKTLISILGTDISPELIPESNDQTVQKSEEVIGPYELQDFFLYYILRYGYKPSKVAYLAWNAWKDTSGSWPDLIPGNRHHKYEIKDIKHWLEVFLNRFFHLSQFKRSALPNGPKIGSGGSLSPRGDWRAPSDISADIWIREMKANVP